MFLTLEAGIVLQDRSCRIWHQGVVDELLKSWQGEFWRLFAAFPVYSIPCRVLNACIGYLQLCRLPRMTLGFQSRAVLSGVMDIDA